MNRQTSSKAAWNLLVLASMACLVYLPAKDAFFRKEGTGDYLTLLKLLPTGVWYTLEITFLGSAAAVLVGLAVGVAKLSRNGGVRLAASLYTETLRGIPLLVLLFYIYYALGEFFHVEAITAAVAGFGFCYGAYMADVFRAGIQAIPEEQGEAALSLGLPPEKSRRRASACRVGRYAPARRRRGP